MLPKTEESAASLPLSREFSPGFIRWIVVITVITIAMVVFPVKYFHVIPDTIHVFAPFSHRTETATLHPWIAASSVTISQGISEFCGEDESPATAKDLRATLIGMLLGFVVGPTLLIVSWRNIHVHHVQDPVNSGNRMNGHHIMFGMGAAMTLFVFLPAMLESYSIPEIYQSMKSGQEVAELRDQMVSEGSEIGYSAYEYKILPRELNGGEKEYTGYAIPDSLAKHGDRSYQIISVGPQKLVVKGSVANSDRSVTITVDSVGNNSNKPENF